jgi:hypothetical protein
MIFEQRDLALSNNAPLAILSGCTKCSRAGAVGLTGEQPVCSSSLN